MIHKASIHDKVKNNGGEEWTMNKRHKIHLIGNAHIDPVWLWRWQEGYAEVKATFQSALDRIKEFPDFIFTSACAAYYKWVEENDPVMFEEIRSRVKEGRWEIVGGMWIQPDCNIPSGESFARHVLYSQRYFMDKFGKTAKVGYNVDSFGHNGMLPQILKKSGMDYYVFQRPGDHEKTLPGNVFWWESPDGSRVLAFKIPFSYTSKGNHEVKDKIRQTFDLAEEQDIDFMCFYGVGNHGGGPTIANIKAIKEMQKQQEGDSIVFSSPKRYFESLEGKTNDLPTVKDDLQHHASGCYSACWQIKADNRKAEHRLVSAEKLATIARQLLNYPYPGKELRTAWEKVLFNHFHDIMGGCSIKEAYDDAKEFHGWALHTADWILNGAVQKLSWAVDTMSTGAKHRSKESHWSLWEYEQKGTPFVMFNPLSWERKCHVQVYAVVKGVTDHEGNPLPLQVVRASRTNGEDKWSTLFEAVIPAFGYRVFWVYREKEFEMSDRTEEVKTNQKNVLETPYIRLELEEHTGYIKSLYDKRYDREVFKGRGAVPVVIDINRCDTWAHGIFEFADEIGRFADATVKLMENGPLRWTVRVTSRYNDSILRQDFIVYRDKPEIEVRVKLDWREKHKMLKLSFPVNTEDPKAYYEIPYGYIERPTNGEEEPGQQWIDVTGKSGEEEYGLSILNDSKYSFGILGNDMRMTVANGSVFADHYGQRYRDDWCEFQDQGVQEFRYVLVPHKGGFQDAQIVKKAYELNVSPVGIMETYHEGPLPQSMEGIRISADHIIAAVFKRSEDNDGYVLRCYETSGKAVKTDIKLPMLQREWSAEFGKCEIKTFLIPDDLSKPVEEKNLLEI
jgi:alpha-mannosidase